MGPLAGHVLAWEVVALTAASSPPVLSESSESHVCPCRATRDRVGPDAAGVAGCWPSYSSRIRVTTAATLGRRLPGGPLPRRGRRGAGIRLRGRPEPTSPSITEGRAGVIKTWVTVRDESKYRQF